MKHIINILKTCKELFITYILSYLIIIISALIYNLSGNDNINSFINIISPLIIIPFYLIISIYLYKKNNKKSHHLPFKKYFPPISLGISIAIFLNMILFLISPPTQVTPPSLLLIISTSIIGPIYEEILFRHIIYNRLATNSPPKKALLLTTTIFALIHISPIKLVYAFILGIFLNISYQKTNSILSPILIHIAANLTAIFLCEYNTYVLLLSFINLLLNIKINNITNNWQTPSNYNII